MAAPGELHDLVDRFHADRSRTPQVNAKDWPIDQLVYELYGLTEAEIVVVEGW